MKMNRVKKISLIIGVAILSIVTDTLYANNFVAPGDSTKIEFNKSFEFETERKVFNQVQKIMDEPEPEKVPEKPEVKYDINGKPIESNISLAKLRPAEMELPVYERTGNGFLRAGLGTYISPLFELMYNNKEAKKHLYGIHLLHESQFAKQKLESDQKVKAPRSNTGLDLSSRFYFKRSVLGVNLGYVNHFNTYYGYVGEVPQSFIDKKDTRFDYGENFSQNHVNAGISYTTDRAEDKVSVDAKLHYKFLQTNFKQKENNIGVNLGLMKKINKLYGGLDIALNYDNLASITRQNPDSSANDVFVSIVPKLSFRGKEFEGTVGIGFDGSFDSDFGNTMVVYPEIDIQYNALKGYLSFYTQLTGGVQNNDYYKTVHENAFIYDGQRVKDAKNQIKAVIGMKGLFASIISYDLFADYRVAKNAHYWGMKKVKEGDAYLYDNRFTAFYQDVNTTTLGLKLNALLSKKTYLTAGVLYHHYNLDKDSTFYKPDFEFNLDGEYRLTQRLSMNSTMRFIGKRKGMVYELDEKGNVVVDSKTPEIASFFNIGIGAKYEMPYDLVLFCDFNNLLNKRNQKWIGYNTNGFEFKLGATWSF